MNYVEFCQQVKACLVCPVRLEAREPVPPEMIGDTIDSWLIYRNPGSTEDAEGRPISPNAPAGGLARELLPAMGITNNYLISNTLFCYTQNDRTPKLGEIQACISTHKKSEWELAKNCKFIVLWGKEATSVFMKFEKFLPVCYKFYNIIVMGVIKPVLIMPHPSYLMRRAKEFEGIRSVVIPRLKEEILGYLQS